MTTDLMAMDTAIMAMAITTMTMPFSAVETTLVLQLLGEADYNGRNLSQGP